MSNPIGSRALVVLPFLTLYACSGETFDEETLLNPSTCAACHPTHFAQWEGSMHAYAAKDPVFLAMNARGQRETNGELGDFCVQCHAPLAVAMGLTEDGLNLDEVPEHLQGVTCAFCHTVTDTLGDHNAMLERGPITTLLGGLSAPFANDAHRSEYSTLHDRNAIESSNLCGTCHDIVTPKGLHLERTFLEWKQSLYSDNTSGIRQTCGNCHMAGSDGPASNNSGSPERRIHDHSMVGVDIALTDFPNRDAQRVAVQFALSTALASQLQVCVSDADATIRLTLENLAAGHFFPSGATQDRRLWVEIIAKQGETVLFETGNVPEGTAVEDVANTDTWQFRDRMTNAAGDPVHMFWEAETITTEGLPPPYNPTAGVTWNTHPIKGWAVTGTPDSVTARVYMRPMGLDVLGSLVDSGDLNPSILTELPTFEITSAAANWTTSDGNDCD